MSVTDGQHKVPVAIKRPAPGWLLARGQVTQRQSRGAPAGPLQSRSARSPPRHQCPGAHGRLRGESWNGGAPGPRSQAAEADTRITLLQAPGVRDRGGRRRGLEVVYTQNFFSSPLSTVRVYKLIWSKKKNKENV